MYIKKLKVPELLLKVIRDKDWKKGLSDNWENIFPEKHGQIYLYDERLIETETEQFLIDLQDETITNSGFNWLGKQSEEFKPGDIDPNKILLIGDLGVDRPFCLDYRINEPRVLYLTGEEYWIEIAKDLDSFFTDLFIPGYLV